MFLGHESGLRYSLACVRKAQSGRGNFSAQDSAPIKRRMYSYVLRFKTTDYLLFLCVNKHFLKNFVLYIYYL